MHRNDEGKKQHNNIMMCKMIDDVLVENGKTLRIARFSILFLEQNCFFFSGANTIDFDDEVFVDSSKGSNKAN